MRGFGLLFVVVAAAVAFYLLSRDLVPPDRLVFAAGSEGGGYHRIAQSYRRVLARDGVEVEVLATRGSVENAALLASGKADVALLQGGVPVVRHVETLGNLFYEPLFIFMRADRPIPANPGAWSGLRLAVGAEGSGTRAAFLSLARSVGVPETANTLLPVGGTRATEALLSGEADAALFVAPIEAPYLEALLTAPNVELLSLEYLAALTGRMEESDSIVLPAGALSLAPPMPAEDAPMLALVARLAAQRDLHPALVDRLVEAARELHADRSPIGGKDLFPNMTGTTLTPDAYARDLIASGPSPLQEYLPYWVVAQINRFAILLLPVVFLLLPLLRLLPGIYAWRMRSRVYKHYQSIVAIEEQADRAETPNELESLDNRLHTIDGEIAKVSLPMPYRDYAYTARLHVDLLRNRIAERIKSLSDGAS